MTTMLKLVLTVIPVLLESGKLDEAATDVAYGKAKADLSAKLNQDFTAIDKEINDFLRENPATVALALPVLVRSLWERRITSGDQYKTMSIDARQVEFDRLTDMVTTYIKQNKDQFHSGAGRRGVSFRYAKGENAVNDKGEPVLANGEPTQHYRINDEDWTKMTAVKETPAETTTAAVEGETKAA